MATSVVLLTCRQTDRTTGRQTNKQTDTQAERQTHRQADRQNDRHTDTLWLKVKLMSEVGGERSLHTTYLS